MTWKDEREKAKEGWRDGEMERRRTPNEHNNKEGMRRSRGRDI